MMIYDENDTTDDAAPVNLIRAPLLFIGHIGYFFYRNSVKLCWFD